MRLESHKLTETHRQAEGFTKKWTNSLKGSEYVTQSVAAADERERKKEQKRKEKKRGANLSDETVNYLDKFNSAS